MSRMMPTQIRESAPRSEQIVFRQLQRGPRAWVVLQSVSVPVPGGNPKEIDFLVLIPDQAVICLGWRAHETAAYSSAASVAGLGPAILCR